MSDLSKVDLTLFQALRPRDVELAIRELARRVEALTGLLDGLTKALVPLGQQHKVIAETVAVLTKLHPPPPDAPAHDQHPWGEVGEKP